MFLSKSGVCYFSRNSNSHPTSEKTKICLEVASGVATFSLEYEGSTCLEKTGINILLKHIKLKKTYMGYYGPIE